MSEKIEKVTLDELLKELVGCLNKFKTPTFSNKDLEKKGISTSFQNLPCTINLKLNTRDWTKSSTTLVKSEFKHLLTSRESVSDKCASDKTNCNETYLTYVEIGVEQTTVTFWRRFRGSWFVRSLCIGILVCVVWLICSVAVGLILPHSEMIVEKKWMYDDGTNSVQRSSLLIRVKKGTIDVEKAN